MGFSLDTFGAVAKIDVFHFVAEDGSESIFAVHESDESLSNEHVAPRKSEGVHEVGIGDVVELPGKLAACVKGDSISNDLQVSFCCLRGNGSLRGMAVDIGVVCGELVANGDLVRVGHAIEPRRHTGHLMLCICCRRENRLG